jgi:hypothetical protein
MWNLDRMPTSCIVRAGRGTLLSLCPSDLTRSWRNDPGPAFMPLVKPLNGLELAGGNESGRLG